MCYHYYYCTKVMIQEQTISFDKLVAALKEMNDKIGSLSYYLFALKYGKVLKNHNLTEIIRSANLTESMSKELSKGLRLYNVLTTNDFGIRLKEDNNNIIWNSQLQNAVLPSEQRESFQQIFYGAPGTGKSHTIKKEEDEGKITCIRTTFHPDSDYATFVGCYKPHKIEGTKDLTYEFVEQAFLEAYKQAWMNPKEEIALVIEEINRGNCAQVFGDIFQLLDRSNDGWSTYPIKADTDIAEHLKELRIPGYAATMNKRFGLDKEGNDRYPDRDWFGFMALPPNMSILATMNTSDQSLFPIDSAFKRRWDWKYIKIKPGKDKEGKKLDWNIQIEDVNGAPVKIIGEETKLSWWKFIQKVNIIIASMTSSADKQLGYFFCKPSKKSNETDEKPTIITADTLVGKVIFYLWNDVFKDYGFEDASLFTYQEEKDGKKMDKDLAFADFYDEEGEQVNTVRLVDFLDKIMKWQNNNTENE